MLSTIGLAVVTFASTNVDDVFVLLAFFADPKFRVGQVALGQFIGIFALVLVGVAVASVSLVLSPEHIGLLGVFPVLIGLKKLVDLLRHDDAPRHEPKVTGVGAVLSVVVVTMANGGDNVGVYAPVSATRSALDIAIIGVVFAIMTAIWLFMAHRLINHPWLGVAIRRYGCRVVPFVLIGLGVLVLHEVGSLQLLGDMARRL